ncbi:acetyltransferase family protein [[Clostridium] bifermentans ATCC 19299]|uniref:GNAT family N-acetyltransferase n=1 Tax=Paraclostridium bifermentans TaxID=1490 RepID=UPI00038C885F|nr:GNAT family N-acetyltransferase [Paraclostridium bifermentans]EQK39572.1 acetyltransferase family protein [[Clostridium] bifermentans ATCC 19299] [Paraclostridium bifermentans ATCC 19299]
MDILIRNMIDSDSLEFYKAFKSQGWNKPVSLFDQYYSEQQSGKRKVFVAACDNQVLGYATLLQNAENGPFSNKNIPIIYDFNVLEKYQRNGVGTAILDYMENQVKEYSNEICLGVGLHYGYGSAQRLYVKRGYIPDGSGVWYNDKVLEQYCDCKNDDDLNLYLSKKL